MLGLGEGEVLGVGLAGGDVSLLARALLAVVIGDVGIGAGLMLAT